MLQPLPVDHYINEAKAARRRPPPIGKCIYCGKQEPEVKLTTEHVVPDGLGGDIELAKASCLACNKITHEFETFIIKKSYPHIRGVLGIQSRKSLRRKERRSQAFVQTGTSLVVREIPFSGTSPWSFASVMAETVPGMFISTFSKITPYNYAAWVNASIDAPIRTLQLAGPGTTLQIQGEMGRHYRMIAKIAHSFACGIARDDFEPCLVDLIMGSDEAFGYYIGTSMRGADPGCIHHLRLYEQWLFESYRPNAPFIKYLVADVQLFANGGGPTYVVVVGRLRAASMSVGNISSQSTERR